MTRDEKLTVAALDSGPPWKITCTVERVGRDLLCRIHGGDRHVGAVALSWWRDGEAFTECLVVGPHKEKGIAVRAAGQLCAATRRSVACRRSPDAFAIA